MHHQSPDTYMQTNIHNFSMAISRCLLRFLLISLFISFCFAEIRFVDIRSDDRPIIPLDEFGFTHLGRLELNVSQIVLSNSNPNVNLDLSKFGFFLCTRDAWMQVLQQLKEGELTCALHSNFVKVVANFNSLNYRPSLDTVYEENGADQYTLVFANCLYQVKVWMKVRSAMYNLDIEKGRRDYLSVGETILSRVYFLLSLVYFTLAWIWIYVLSKKRLTVFRIHFLMLAVVILKAFNLVYEAEYKSFVKRTGNAQGWDVLFYIFSFLKGIALFTLIVLIGSGWSFLKPNLLGKEKKVLMIVIPLQVVANMAQVFIQMNGPYGQYWIVWKQVFLLADAVCLIAVLFPIVWSIKSLDEAVRIRTEDKLAAGSLMKELSLFRRYYIVVICYICCTRVLVYALGAFTSYKYAWSSVVSGELATLAFYALTGYMFKPQAVDPYVVTVDDDEEKDQEPLKPEDHGYVVTVDDEEEKDEEPLKPEDHGFET